MEKIEEGQEVLCPRCRTYWIAETDEVGSYFCARCRHRKLMDKICGRTKPLDDPRLHDIMSRRGDNSQNKKD